MILSQSALAKRIAMNSLMAGVFIAFVVDPVSGSRQRRRLGRRHRKRASKVQWTNKEIHEHNKAERKAKLKAHTDGLEAIMRDLNSGKTTVKDLLRRTIHRGLTESWDADVSRKPFYGSQERWLFHDFPMVDDNRKDELAGVVQTMYEKDPAMINSWIENSELLNPEQKAVLEAGNTLFLLELVNLASHYEGGGFERTHLMNGDDNMRNKYKRTQKSFNAMMERTLSRFNMIMGTDAPTSAPTPSPSAQPSAQPTAEPSLDMIPALTSSCSRANADQAIFWTVAVFGAQILQRFRNCLRKSRESKGTLPEPIPVGKAKSKPSTGSRKRR